MMLFEAAAGVVGLWLLLLQAGGAIAWPMEVVLSPFWSVGALRGLWSAFSGIVAVTLVCRRWAEIRDAQYRFRQQLCRAEKRKARR